MARLRERIPIVLDLLDLGQFLSDLNIAGDIQSIVSDYLIQKEVLTEYWNTNPDLRLTQVLVNMGIMPNYMGSWYYQEEDDYLIEKGLLKFEEIHFWGVNYDKENKRLPATIFKRLIDLDTDHIRNIYNFFETKTSTGIAGINKEYREYFESRLREEGKNQSNDLLNGLFENKKDEDE